MTAFKTVYYDENGPERQPGFRGGGSAWWVRPEADRPWDEHFGEFEISEQLYWSLFHLGIVDAFYELPIEGILGSYEEGVSLASGLPRAADILREQADHLAENRYEWDCSKQFSPETIDYKVIVEAKRLKEELVALADFLDAGASRGYNVQLWL